MTNDKRQMIRVGVVGAGFITRFQAVAMKQVRGMEFCALTQRQGTPAVVKMARDFGLGEPRVYDSVYEMAKQVDCVAIFSPNYTRIPVMEEIVAAVKAGAELKGVICEKPLGRTVAEARRLVQLSQSANLRTAYFENQVFMKPMRAQLAQLEPVQRTMGPLTLVRSSEEHAGPHEAWFWDPKRQGGGVLSDMGCHSIAASWFALNPPGKETTFLQPQSVSGHGSLHGRRIAAHGRLIGSRNPAGA
jgi:predicted dehydrogenase